jgi:hypothetical protein
MGKWSCYGQILKNSELLTTAEVLVEAGENEAGLDTYKNLLNYLIQIHLYSKY